MAPKVGVRTLEFGLMVLGVTAVGLGATRLFGKSDEEKEKELRHLYGDRIKASESSKKNMQAFFDTMKKNQQQQVAGADGTQQEDKFADLLRGGKGEIKNQSLNVGRELRDVPVVTTPLPLQPKKKKSKDQDANEPKSSTGK